MFHLQTAISAPVRAAMMILTTMTAVVVNADCQDPRAVDAPKSIAVDTLIKIMKAEDERRWDNDLKELAEDKNIAVRKRALLAIGRIGNKDSVATVVTHLNSDPDVGVRAMAAFALGEIEEESGAADALMGLLKNNSERGELRARTVEALGKIAAALPKEKEARQRELGLTILEVLKTEGQSPSFDKLTVLLALTAALRAKPADSGAVIAGFLNNPDARVRADAANTLARLRLKDGNDKLRTLLISDPDPVVRANAARVLGGTVDKASLASLVDRATNDADVRVRVSAIRALGSLQDPSVKLALVQSAHGLLKQYSSERSPLKTVSSVQNELLEIVSALSHISSSLTEDDVAWMKDFRKSEDLVNPEVEIALAKISARNYLESFGATTPDASKKVQESILLNWRAASSIAQGLGEIASSKDKPQQDVAAEAEALLRALLDYRNSAVKVKTLAVVHSEYAIPDVLRALADFKPADLASVLGAQLNESDVIVRATAAELIGDLPPSDENTQALAKAWATTINDNLNDAALSILEALAKQKSAAANGVIQKALESKDYLVRRRAMELLKTNGSGDFSNRLGVVQTRNTPADYRRALGRLGKDPFALVTTSKGSFTIELFPDAAPLTVDNFIRLALNGYFRNLTVHRVVPNFVIQDGDPRGDGNGGPGYQIRCEINQVPYDRAVVGMALSGKDTGGSQWFITHSPQPHLDGGYTVFGRVIKGMEVVDNIVRGDIIQSVQIK